MTGVLTLLPLRWRRRCRDRDGKCKERLLLNGARLHEGRVCFSNMFNLVRYLLLPTEFQSLIFVYVFVYFMFV